MNRARGEARLRTVAAGVTTITPFNVVRLGRCLPLIAENRALLDLLRAYARPSATSGR